MKNLKLSFALIIAIVAVGFTVASKANFNGSKAVSGCFEQLVLTNAATSPTTYAPQATDDCDFIKSTILSLKYLDAQPVLSSERFDCAPEPEEYCCIKFDIASPSDPNYSRIPIVDLNDGQGPQKWIAVEVLCEFE